MVTRGLILYGGRVLNRGMAWGDDVILSDKRYFLPFHARAMTYVDVMVLDRETLMQVMVIFPVSSARLRKKVIYLALRRHLLNARREVLDSSFQRRSSESNGGICGARSSFKKRQGFMDRMSSQPSFAEVLEQRENTSGRKFKRSSSKKGGGPLSRLRSSSPSLKRKSSKATMSGEEMSAVRTSAVELALLLQDKQISQSEWRGGTHGGHDQAATMAHAEMMAAISALSAEVQGLRKEVQSMRESPPPPASQQQQQQQHQPGQAGRDECEEGSRDCIASLSVAHEQQPPRVLDRVGAWDERAAERIGTGQHYTCRSQSETRGRQRRALQAQQQQQQDSSEESSEENKDQSLYI